MQRFSAEFLTTIATDVFAALQAPRAEARIVAEHLVLSNLMGLDSHGVVRIPLYTRWTREGPIRPGAAISTMQANQAVTIVDCGYNFGQVNAPRATEMAVARAKEPVSVAYHAIWGRGGGAAPHDRIGVFGAGPSGLFATQIALVSGAQVVVVEPAS